ncbi:MAG: SUMF1/EgtB/PvdO family nonheme iron enzyme [Acidobacteriota bacterium]|nr:SUMF1/EgtB/PvdO family nonheme iron enzyme [Acidobacteriota bacterium]
MRLADFNLPVKWLGQLAKLLQQKKKERNAEINALASELVVKPLDLARTYVEPDCQQYNPADRDQGPVVEVKQPVFEHFQSFLRQPVPFEDGSGHLFVLADAGMGKTSLLAMIKMGQVMALWPKGYRCVALKLGPETLGKIAQIDEAFRTVLLLDSLDEDPEAMGPGQIRARIDAILKATCHFLRVIITCRTQFFPRGERDTFGRLDRVVLGRFRCQVIYLSLFNDDQVHAYLDKRFPLPWWRHIFGQSRPEVAEALAIVQRMQVLRFRPMMLAYIEDLMKAPKLSGNTYDIYHTLIQAWLNREVAKSNVQLNREELARASLALAHAMTISGKRKMSPEELAQLDEPAVKKLPSLVIEGRSLLNKNSDGHFRFAHYSVQEFLFVWQAVRRKKWPTGVRPTDVMLTFLTEAGLENVDLSGIDLSGLNLGGYSLNRVNWKGANLRDVNLVSADLRGAYLGGADLQGADLRNAALPTDNWVWIPPGSFTMGEEKQKRGVEFTGGFLLARFPVTKREYHAFLEAGGYGNAEWWSEEGWTWLTLSDEEFPNWYMQKKARKGGIYFPPEEYCRPAKEPHYWKDKRFNQPDQPVVGINCWEAEAYCRWLTTKLTVEQPSWWFANQTVCLPSEAMWEYAARGEEGRAYPWGNEEPTKEHANYGSNKGEPTPRGNYPKGATPEGVQDMAGNVWEWCLDPWQEETKANTGNKIVDPFKPGERVEASGRVVRGGSWNDDADFLRAAVRDGFFAGYRSRYIGFRCVVVSASLEP